MICGNGAPIVMGLILSRWIEMYGGESAAVFAIPVSIRSWLLSKCNEKIATAKAEYTAATDTVYMV